MKLIHEEKKNYFLEPVESKVSWELLTKYLKTVKSMTHMTIFLDIATSTRHSAGLGNQSR